MNHHEGHLDLPSDLDRIEVSLLQSLLDLAPAPQHSATPDTNSKPGLTADVAAELFEAQVESRLVDHAARWLRAEHGTGYYTIGSAGHESNGAVALALRPTDPALLHYRSGGFYFARATQQPNQDPVGDVLRGVLAVTTDQISGGRHKMFGNKSLGIIPQTSTIASHLPRAVGLATSIGWSRRPGAAGAADRRWPSDAVVVCSFGDASLNHSTAQGAMNWACNSASRGRPVPILFLCEDNGLGISVSTPETWVAQSTRTRPGLAWATADGHDPAQVLRSSQQLVDQIRVDGRPAFLHLNTVRYLGHAGTDVESAYRSPASIRLDLDRDPLLGSAREVVLSGICAGVELVEWYLERRSQIRKRALGIATESQLASATEVMAPLTVPDPTAANERAVELAHGAERPRSPSDDTGRGPALTLAQTINQTLALLLEQNRSTLVFGEDIGRKGGVYGVTRGLQADFGDDRVFDTILDEQTVFGLALGASLNGYLPIPEIQYLAYLHNGQDQLRGEAASLRFFSNGQFTNPMVVRIASYGYQKGFGGHFHNDNSIAVLRDVPGLIIASPSHPSDAAAMFISCAASAETNGSVCVYLEPIARYHTVDLHADGDRGWAAPLAIDPVPIGSARVHGRGVDGTILTWGNGLFLSLRAQRRLSQQHGENWRVVDLRWLAPLPTEDMLRESVATGRVLVVDETRQSGGVGEAVVSTLVLNGFNGSIDCLAAHNTFIPLGPAARFVLVSEDQIVQAALLSGLSPNSQVRR